MVRRPTGRSRTHDADPQKDRDADAKRMAKVGWLVTGGVTLVTGIVLMFVMDTHDSLIHAERNELRQFEEWVKSHPQDPVKTPSLKEKLSTIEAHLASAPTTDILVKLFKDVRDAELKGQATDAGGDLLERYNRARKEVTKRYLDGLRTAATAAASATTGEQLAPYGPLEDTIRVVLHEAMAPGPTKDAEAQAYYEPMWKQTYIEINQIVAKLFDEAYQNKVPWTNLLADTSGWTIIPSSSFKHTFDASLTLVNEPGGQSMSGGLSYTPADKWRDYVLEVEFKIDSGTLVFYTRIGDKMDVKECPGFSVSGAKDPKVPIEFGKTYTMVISVIGNQLTVTGEGISPHTEPTKSTMSRKGEPGIKAPAGTTATITKLRARHLR